MDIINFETATDAELDAFLREHPGHAELLRTTHKLDAETVTALTCMATAYTNGATDTEALDTFNRALSFYGREPITNAPRIRGEG